MTYSAQLYLVLTSLVTAKVPSSGAGSDPASLPLQEHLQPAFAQILDLVASFRAAAVSPEATLTTLDSEVRPRLDGHV